MLLNTSNLQPRLLVDFLQPRAYYGIPDETDDCLRGAALRWLGAELDTGLGAAILRLSGSAAGRSRIRGQLSPVRAITAGSSAQPSDPDKLLSMSCTK